MTDRIPYGEETELTMRDVLGDSFNEDAHNTRLYIPHDAETCPDCAVAQGEIHLDGCDIEQCSECGRQLIGCEHASEDER